MGKYEILNINLLMNIDHNVINELIEQYFYNKALVEDYETLRFYLILTHYPFLIRNNTLNKATILVNRYYWFRKFYRTYKEINGLDAGIEQQLGSIIGDINNEIYNFDWSEIQKINDEIDSE